MKELVITIILAAFVNNMVLSQFFGVTPFLEGSKRIKSALGMGTAMGILLILSSLGSSLVYRFLLEPFEITYLQTFVFVLIILILIYFMDQGIKRCKWDRVKKIGRYLPVLMTNCAVLGVVLTHVQKEYGVLESFLSGLASAAGFFMVTLIMAGLQEKIEKNDIPKAFQGVPIGLVTAGLMAIAFYGFTSFL